MTKVLSKNAENLINSLAIIGDVNFDRARTFAESGGFHLIADGLELEEWCVRQAMNENLDAQHALSEFLFIGLFGRQDKTSAYDWCRRAAEAGHVPSIYMLAGFVEDGFESPIADLRTALELTEHAAEHGYVPGLRSLAIMYLTGSGVAIDSKKAYEYFDRAAKGGDAYSQFMLGTMLIDLREEEAVAAGVRLVKASADQAFPPALKRISHFYLDGRYGFSQDMNQSARYSLQAELAESSKRLTSINP